MTDASSKGKGVELSPAPRIVGGENSNPVPSFVSLLSSSDDGESWQLGGCAGTLISTCHVLTAAHCFNRDDKGALYVNSWRPSAGNHKDSMHFSRIRNYKVHDNFKKGEYSNDVAIIKMESCILIEQKYDYPIMHLADFELLNSIAEGSELTVVGLGRLGESGNYPNQLQAVDVPYITNTQCSNYYPYSITEDMICAGFPNGEKDACQGDSGGPLFYAKAEQERVQVGIVSWGTGCARPDYPGVYASVAHHRNWIANLVCKDAEAESTYDLCSDKQRPQLGEACSDDNPCEQGLRCRRVRGAFVCQQIGAKDKSSIQEGSGGSRGRRTH